MPVSVLCQTAAGACLGLLLAATLACNGSNTPPSHPEVRPVIESQRDVLSKSEPAPANATAEGTLETATFGAGCYWCVEAVFQQLEGVVSVESGFSGGSVENPTYKQVCTGTTGHAEVCQITFKPDVISFEQLLEVFWKTHDPTTLNRQGHDVGSQYRSAIFYHNQKQKALAEEYKQKLDRSGAFAAPIVTQIVPFERFYKAEDYHQNYFRDHPEQAYCRTVIGPKIEKFQKVFADKLKRD